MDTRKSYWDPNERQNNKQQGRSQDVTEAMILFPPPTPLEKKWPATKNKV